MRAPDKLELEVNGPTYLHASVGFRAETVVLTIGREVGVTRLAVTDEDGIEVEYEARHLQIAGTFHRVVPNLIVGGWTDLVEVDPVWILFYEDGTVRVGHVCDRGDRGIVRCAPALGDSYTISARTPLTVTPSILCPDCGLHGFITDGVWHPA